MYYILCNNCVNNKCVIIYYIFIYILWFICILFSQPLDSLPDPVTFHTGWGLIIAVMCEHQIYTYACLCHIECPVLRRDEVISALWPCLNLQVCWSELRWEQCPSDCQQWSSAVSLKTDHKQITYTHGAKSKKRNHFWGYRNALNCLLSWRTMDLPQTTKH